MFCKKCGAQNADQSRFCKKCGNELGVSRSSGQTFPGQDSQEIKKRNKKILEIVGGVIAFALIIKMSIIGYYPSEWPFLIVGFAAAGGCFYIASKIKIEV